MKRSEALRLRSIIEQATVSLDDKTASEGAMLFPRLKGNGELVKAGTRVNWNSKIKRADVDLWDTKANTPDNAPTLWEDLNYRDGYRIIPPAITVTSSFAKDECGWWGDKLYKSLRDVNIYTPDQHRAGWEEVTI